MKIVAVLTSFLALAACSTTATTQVAPAAPASVKLYALDCGHMRFTDLDEFSDTHDYKGIARELIVPCYLIRHPGGDLVWDTGLTEALAALPNGFTPPGEPVTVSMPKRLTTQLGELGLAPKDIEFVSFSHLHSDHTGNANLFAGSTWIVDKDEHTEMFTPARRAAVEDFRNYSALETARTTLIEGDGDYDVFGDGSVVIVQAPGHTRGHTVLLVNLKSGPVILSGDMWHVAEARAKRTVPPYNVNRAQTLASMDKVEALAARTNARVIRQHVMEDFTALPVLPVGLE